MRKASSKANRGDPRYTGIFSQQGQNDVTERSRQQQFIKQNHISYFARYGTSLPEHFLIVLNHRSMRHHSVLRNDHYTVANEVQRMIEIVRLSRGRDHYVISNPRILIDD